MSISGNKVHNDNQRFGKKGEFLSPEKSVFSKKKGYFLAKMSVKRGCFSDWGTLICPT